MVDTSAIFELVKERNKVLIIGIVLALCGLVWVQTYLLIEGFKRSEESYDRNVQLVLQNVTNQLLVQNIRREVTQVLDTTYTDSSQIQIEIRETFEHDSVLHNNHIDQKIHVKRINHSKKKKGATGDLITQDIETRELANVIVEEMLGEDREQLWLSRIDSFDFGEKITEQLGTFGLGNQFEYAVKRDGDVLKASKGFTDDGKTYKKWLPSGVVLKNNCVVLLKLPNRAYNIFSKILVPLVLSVVFVVLASLLFVYLFGLYKRQKEVSEARDDFINSMSHELKTPLATIALSLENLKMEQPENKNYVSIIREENNRMHYYIENILQLAHLDTTEFVLHSQKTDLSQLVQNVVQREQLRVENQDGELILETPSELWLSLDSMHLSNVLHNLIDNAIKYNSNPPKIVLNIEEKEDEVLISVSDNGEGIKVQDLDKVFDKFYRVSKGNLYKNKGTGIGLSYAKHIIELHNGSIEVQSKEGYGSTFVIKLPNE